MFDFSNKMDALYKSMGKVETNTHANINEILDNLNNLFNHNSVEKSYTKREFVPGNGKRKKINLAKLQGLYKSVEGGQFSIYRTSNASSSDLSAFPDNLTIPQIQKNTISKAKKEELIKKSGIVEYYLGINKSLNKSNSTSGEGFFYKSQKQITEYWLNYFDELSNELYNNICDYIGLPKANIVSKSVIYKGKIIYNPESGKPISKMDLDRLVKVTTKFLNRNRKAGENLVKQSQVLGALLEKLSNTNSASTLKKLGIEDLSIKNVKYETLCENETKAAQLLGLDRETFNRIELMKQSAAQHITGIDSKLQNDIQSVLIDGVKNKKNKTQVSEELFKKFGAANRDWKKIADTEIQNNLNESYIRESVKNSKDGEKVYFQRMEVIDDRTCSYCKQMNGTVVMYSSIPLASDKINDKYASRAIWDGKTWDGDNKTLTNGIFHPSCRGVWVKWKPLD